MSRFGHPGCNRAVSAALWLLLADCVQASEVVNLHAVQQATTSAIAIEQAQRLKSLADRQAVDELVAELQRLTQDPTQASIAREWLLDRGLHELSRVKPTLTARTLAQSLTQRQPQIFVRVDPDHGQQTVPLYDPAATARFVLKAWERTAAREQAAAALSASRSAPIDVFARNDAAAESDPVKAGILDAFRTAPTNELALHRAAIAAAMERGEHIDEIAAITAQKLGDIELYDAVIDQADARVALDALKGARGQFTDATTLGLLIRASRRQEIASAATLEIGRLAEHDANARKYLFDQLSDPATASSAATALASQRDPAVAAELGRRLGATLSEPMRRQLVLALKLDGSPAARKQLDQFAKTGAGSQKLKKEVSAWLAR